MTKKRIPHPLILTIMLTCGLAGSAHAEIYSFIDEDGVTHFSNIPTDSRYVPFGVSGPHRALNKQGTVPPVGRRPEPAVKAQYRSLIETIARTYALESALIHAVVSAESGYNSTAI